MAEAKSESKKSKQFLRERRLVALSQLNFATLAVGFIGAGAFGAGTYGRWIGQPPSDMATSLLIIGAVGAAFLAWQLIREGSAVRVGDAGVAIERGGQVERLLWCDMDRIQVQQDYLVLSGTGPTLSIAQTSQARAISWILKEAAQRLPKLIDVQPSYADRLPKPQDDDGTQGAILSLQTTGRRCAQSRKVIRYERDARLCVGCTQVYLKDEMPENCITCGRTLDGNTAVP